LSPELALRHRVFLLSPANLAGIRAAQVLNAKAEFELACRLRETGVPLGELFSFISGLYFRGKVTYAGAFSRPPQGVSGSFVITTSAGLLAPETVVSVERLREFAATDIDPADKRYRGPLDRDCRLLAEFLKDAGQVILLGSIATPKYVEPLLDIFRERLLFPAEFVGRGDMSRGGILLRAVAAGKELAYIPLLNAVRRGTRPAKLAPLKVRRVSLEDVERAR